MPLGGKAGPSKRCVSTGTVQADPCLSDSLLLRKPGDEFLVLGNVINHGHLTDEGQGWGCRGFRRPLNTTRNELASS
jgi:hypothetical protein